MAHTRPGSFRLSRPAEDVYAAGTAKREPVLKMGREMSRLTIPMVMPPEGYETGDELEGQNQSINALLVAGLASQLMFMAFPPGLPILKYIPIEYRLQANIAEDPELWSKTELSLSRLEMIHRESLMTTSLSSTYVGFITLLLVAGNALWRHIEFNSPRYHTPEDYIVVRDRYGQQTLIILREEVDLLEEDQDVQDLVLGVSPELLEVVEWERKAVIHTVQKLCVDDDGTKCWEYWQEYKGHKLPDTEVETDFDTPPMSAEWLIPVKGKNWGHGYCEDKKGDLYTLEANASALNDGAVAAALNLIFVKPGRTSIRQVKKANNLDVLSGSAEDVSMFRTDKSADMNFVGANLERTAQRLGRAFLSASSIQRSAERVTAEEWQRMGAEMDKAMGGLYTQTAQSTNRYILLRAIRLNEEENKSIPRPPRELVEIRVATGIDAMGRSVEGAALDRAMARVSSAMSNPQMQAIVNIHDYARRVFASEGIKPDGLVKTQEQTQAGMDQQQQQAMQQTLLDKGTGPAIQTLGKGLVDHLTAQQQANQETQQ